MFNQLPKLDYSWVSLRKLCGRLRQNMPEIQLAGHRIAVQNIYPDYLASNSTVFEHTHPFFETHIIMSGKIQFLSGSRQIMGPGHLFIFPPQTPHTWQVLDEPCLDINISFHVQPEMPITLPELWPTNFKAIWELALLLSDIEEQSDGWQDRSLAHFTAIFSRMLAIVRKSEKETDREVASPSLTALVEQYISDHLNDQFSLDDIGAWVGCGRRSLTRYFRDQTGLSIMDYCRRMRLESAMQILLNSELSITEIGKEVGMPNIPYFCHCFRKYTGMTPQAYRKANSAKPSALCIPSNPDE